MLTREAFVDNGRSPRTDTSQFLLGHVRSLLPQGEQRTCPERHWWTGAEAVWPQLSQRRRSQIPHEILPNFDEDGEDGDEGSATLAATLLLVGVPVLPVAASVAAVSSGVLIFFVVTSTLAS